LAGVDSIVGLPELRCVNGTLAPVIVDYFMTAACQNHSKSKPFSLQKTKTMNKTS